MTRIVQTCNVGRRGPKDNDLQYRRQVEDFGAPGGPCSSVTESRHITAVRMGRVALAQTHGELDNHFLIRSSTPLSSGY